MRATTLLAPLWLLGCSLVKANYDSRGPEVEFFYRAYRMDVELSVAEFLADPSNAGKDPNVEKPWKLGRNLKSQNDDADWPGGQRTPGYGLNFHGWMQGVDAGGKYGVKEARTRITDPWNPDFRAAFADVRANNGRGDVEKQKNIMRLHLNSDTELDPIDSNSQNKYSFTGFDPVAIFGDLSERGKKGPADNYFEFDNMLGIVAKRTKELYESNPDLGRPHYEAMSRSLAQAHQGRMMESRRYQLEAAQEVLYEYEKKKKLQKGTIANHPNILRTINVDSPNRQGDWYPGWRTKQLDVESTRNNWPVSLKSHKVAIMGNPLDTSPNRPRGEMEVFVNNWQNGDLSILKRKKNHKGVEVGDPIRATPSGMGSSHTHLQVIRAETRLINSINAQIEGGGDPDAPGCEWWDTRGPGQKGSVPDPLRRRHAFEELKSVMAAADKLQAEGNRQF